MTLMEANAVPRRPLHRSAARAGTIWVTYLLACTGGGALCANEPAAAPAPPVTDVTAGPAIPGFQPGLWQYRRTLISVPAGKPQVTIVKKCTSPSADIEQKMAQLRKKSCQFTTVRREHDHYVSSWVCPTPSGAMRFRDVLSAKDATAYEDVSEARLGQHVTQQRIEATRLGDCTAAPEGPAAPPAAAIGHDSTAAAR
jgi:Protein of unknown function (DUF3617)